MKISRYAKYEIDLEASVHLKVDPAVEGNLERVVGDGVKSPFPGKCQTKVPRPSLAVVIKTRDRSALSHPANAKTFAYHWI